MCRIQHARWSLLVGALFLGVLGASAQTSGQGNAQSSPAVVFVCEHGSAKSVTAAAHFNRMAAERGLSIRAVARGIEPDPELAPAAVNGLRADGLLPTASAPQKLERADLQSAIAVITFNDLPAELAAGIAVQRWEVPPISADYAASRDAIVARVELLIAAIALPSPEQRLTDLLEVEELRTAFNRDAGKTRLVLLLSPT